MRTVVVLLLVWVGTARAEDPSAQRDLVVEYTRLARDSAAAGQCDTVRELGERVRTLDAAYHASAFVIDAAIAKCLPPPSPLPSPGPVEPPPDIAPRVPHDEPVTPAPVPVTPRGPPLDPGRVIGEFFGGGLASLLGLLGGGLVGFAFCGDNNRGDDCLAAIIVSAYAGGCAMFGVGVYAIGNTNGETGSLGTAILGGLLGGAVGIGSAILLERENVDAGGFYALLLFGGPAVGALVGFNSTRRWKTPPAIARARSFGSFVTLEGSRPSLGLPLVMRHRMQGTPTTSLSLISGRF